MFSSLRLVSWSPQLSGPARAAAEGVLADAAHASGATSTLFAPTCAGVWNGGDLIWRSEYRDESHWRDSEAGSRFREAAALLADAVRVRLVEHVAYEGAGGGVSPRKGLYRVALFCANRSPTPARLACFAAETRAMPRHVRSIRRWQLSTPAHASGSRTWTHVWEQEYDDLGGLTGPYMLHPCHWGEVDRWFDPESPERIVALDFAHVFCVMPRSVLAS